MFRRMASTMTSVEFPRPVVVDIKDMLAHYVTWQNAITIAAAATAVNQFMTKSQIDALRSDINANQAMTKFQIDALKDDVNGLKVDVNGLKSDVSELKSDVAELKRGLQELTGKIDDVLDGRRRWFR